MTVHKPLGVREMARELDVSPAMIIKLRSAGMPMHDADEARRWRESNTRTRPHLAARKARQAPVEAPAEGESYSAWRTRREKALAHLAEIDLAERRGQLVAVDQVLHLLGQRYSIARDRLWGIPSRIAPMAAGLDAHRAERVLMQEISDALTEIANAAADVRAAAGKS